LQAGASGVTFAQCTEGMVQNLQHEGRDMAEGPKQTREEILAELNKPSSPEALAQARLDNPAMTGGDVGKMLFMFGVLGLGGWGLFSTCTREPSAAELDRRWRSDAAYVGERRLRASLKDPDGAKVEGVRAVGTEKDHVVCGFVNAKNSFGAYSGRQAFVVQGGRVFVGEGKATDASLAAFSRCLAPQ
jgi:hypothetical protein